MVVLVIAPGWRFTDPFFLGVRRLAKGFFQSV